MRHTFQSEQFLPYPLELVFSLLANPETLPPLMPAWQKARIEEANIVPPPPRPAGSSRYGSIAAGVGTKMTISFRPFPFSPVRVPWDAEIVEFAWNDHFCDLQHRGPFAYWRHCHHAAAETRDTVPGTLVKDSITYELPLGPLGDLANGVFMRRQLASTFAYRQRRLAKMLGKITAPAKPR